MKHLCCLLAIAFTAAPCAAQIEDEHARYELLGPDTATFRVTLDFAATRPGTTSFSGSIPRGAAVTEVSAIDLATGATLKTSQDSGRLTVHLARPVPEGAETRVRLTATYKDPLAYSREGTSIIFHTFDVHPRSAIVLPAGYEVAAANVPVQVLEEPDGRIVASFMLQPPGYTTPAPGNTKVYVLARPIARKPTASPSVPTTAPSPPIADAPPREQPMNQIRVTERALQDREIVYFLKEPETHAFSLYHDYTAQREGEHQYVNVVRAGSSVSDPSAKILDTGEVLKTRTLTGADVVREKIDIPDRVEPDTQLVIIPFPPVKKGESVRLRISETYTDPARYALVDGQLMWRRSFGRPRNDMVLPAGWYLTTSSIPAVITPEPDGSGRIRLSFWNPRPDNVDVFVKARRR